MEAATKRQILYEDNLLYVIMAEHPMTEGHVQVVSKKNVKHVEDLSSPETSHMFFVASYCASALFEVMKAHGTNIVMNNGRCGLYEEAVPIINVIARFTDDNIDFKWKPKQVEAPVMEELRQRLSSSMQMKEKAEAVMVPASPVSKPAYVLHHDRFQRIP